MSQFFHVLMHQSLGDAVEGGAGEVKDVALRTTYVFQQQFPRFLFVVRAYQLAEQRVDIVLLAFLLELTVVVDNDSRNHAHHQYHGDEAAEMVGGGNQEADDEGGSGGDKPTTDNRNHTGDAVNCCFATPGTVGQRRTHGNHEGYISGGEG